MLFARAPTVPVRYIFSFFRTDVYTLSRVGFLTAATARTGVESLCTALPVAGDAGKCHKI